MVDLTESYDTRFDTIPMSVKDWFITILVLAIPIVGVVMYLIWAFGSSGNLNRRNFCRASLLWVAIGFAVFFVFILFAGGLALISNL
jgi:hypothetical protein